jgi:hypothetical protein
MERLLALCVVHHVIDVMDQQISIAFLAHHTSRGPTFLVADAFFAKLQTAEVAYPPISRFAVFAHQDSTKILLMVYV